MTRTEIRTEDTAWAAQNSTPGRNGRVTVTVPGAVERVTFAGIPMVRFDMLTVASDLPSDWANRWAMVPAAWTV